jgi:membrane-associated HD superfamily phosphohydrolase
MKNDPATPIFIAYFVLWIVLAMASTIHMRLLRSPKDKKKWADRYTVIGVVFVIGSACAMSVLWKQYLLMPVFFVFGAVIIFLNLRCSFFCDSCAKRSRMQNPFASSFHCSHCGNKLK